MAMLLGLLADVFLEGQSGFESKDAPWLALLSAQEKTGAVAVSGFSVFLDLLLVQLP